MQIRDGEHVRGKEHEGRGNEEGKRRGPVVIYSKRIPLQGWENDYNRSELACFFLTLLFWLRGPRSSLPHPRDSFFFPGLFFDLAPERERERERERESIIKNTRNKPTLLLRAYTHVGRYL